MAKKTVLAVLFDTVTFLDFNGPQTAMWVTRGHYEIETVALKSKGGAIIVTQEGTRVIADYTFETVPQKKYDILMIPGNKPFEENDEGLEEFYSQLKTLSQQCEMVFTICTGSGYFARTGLLDGKEATSNKLFWEWAKSQSPNVRWEYPWRWADDTEGGNGKRVLTSAGVSAGIDAALYLISTQFGEKLAEDAAKRMEYNWNKKREEFEWDFKDEHPQKGLKSLH